MYTMYQCPRFLCNSICACWPVLKHDMPPNLYWLDDNMSAFVFWRAVHQQTSKSRHGGIRVVLVVLLRQRSVWCDFNKSPCPPHQSLSPHWHNKASINGVAEPSIEEADGAIGWMQCKCWVTTSFILDVAGGHSKTGQDICIYWMWKCIAVSNAVWSISIVDMLQNKFV